MRWSARRPYIAATASLARLTLNIAAVHHDAAAAGGRRLVYGGHTIGIAMAQICRALPNLITVLGWRSCDHLAPVNEGDRLTSTIDVERVEDNPGGGQVIQQRSQVSAEREASAERIAVLAWRLVVLSA
jgi:acyl dehydratase